MAKAAIMGFGTVGSGVYEIIRDSNFTELLGEEMNVKYILDIRDFDDEELKPMLTKYFNDILNLFSMIKAGFELLVNQYPKHIELTAMGGV